MVSGVMPPPLLLALALASGAAGPFAACQVTRTIIPVATLLARSPF